jgi:solute carrier family 25 phosphate transporter 23/24/25/41
MLLSLHAHLRTFSCQSCGASSCVPIVQLTYPLDTLRLRLAVDPKLRGVQGAITVLLKEGSGAAFYRGLGASMLGKFT